MPDFNHMTYLNVSLLLFSSLVTAFMLFGLFMSRLRKRDFNSKMMCLLLAQILMQLGEAGIWYWNGSPDKAWLIKLCCFLSFGLGLAVTALFVYCFMELLRQRGKVSMVPLQLLSIICGLGFVLSGASMFNGIFFDVDTKGYFVYGPYAAWIEYIDYANFAIIFGVALYNRKIISVKGFAMISIYSLLHLGGMLMVDVWYPTPFYLASTLALIVLCNFLYEAIEEAYLQKEKELMESRIALMISQIQPHFLYNSLNSIYHLCDMDARLAQQAIGDFSEYLHHVLGSLKRTTPVLFEQELQNVKAYLELEKLRFEDLNIVYKIEASNFLVPALSVQPLVENAVKHGICGKEDGGTLVLSTKEQADCFEVIVEDDGIGFDIASLPDNGDKHLGVQNVKQRLAAMVGGSLSITSTPGEGTTAIIRVPKEGSK
ncbi:MAG: sensor histidine kinase [Phascolarctobacterium sp.]